MFCFEGTSTWELGCELSNPINEADALKSEIKTYFDSECGHFPFERVYTVVDSELWHYWIKRNCNFFFCHFSGYLLESLHMHDCPYANVTAAVINFYAGTFSNKLNLKIFREFSDTLKKPLVNVCNGINYEYHNRDIYTAIRKKDLIFFKVLVRYGVLRAAVSENRKDFYACLNTLRKYIDSIAVRLPRSHYGLPSTIPPSAQRRIGDTTILRLPRPDCGLSSAVEEHAITVVNRLNLLYEKIQSNPALGCKLLRKQTIIKVLQMLSCEESWSSEFAAEGLRLYFDATTENFVTVREIQELIDLPQQSLEMFNEEKIESIYKLLRNVFPDSDILQPRTLEHLSRCAVRADLTEKGVLPEVVAKLRIPDVIKDYILILKTGS